MEEKRRKDKMIAEAAITEKPGAEMATEGQPSVEKTVEEQKKEKQPAQEQRAEEPPAEEPLTEEQLQAAIEAVLFAMGEAVELEKLARALGQEKSRIQALLERMIERCQKEDRGIEIIRLDDSYQLCTKPGMYAYLIRMAKQPKKITLSDAAMETLSIIAYKQPVTKLELEKIRGVRCDHAVNRLIEYDLVKEVGRLDAPGRPLLFGTTEAFLRHFGISSLEDLPEINPVQAEDFKAEAEAEIQAKLKV